MKTNPSVLLMLAFALVGPPFVHPASADPLPNAWQITDNSAASLLNYTTNLPTGLRIAATNVGGGFRFRVNARFVDDFGGSKTMAMGYGLSSDRFLIWWQLNTNGDLTAELEGTTTLTLTTNGTGTALYHTHEILYNPTNQKCTYLFDGQVMTTNWVKSTNNLTAGQVYWGAGSSAGQAQMNFNRATFEITNTVVADYYAGTQGGSPAIAPNPTNQSWTLNGSGTNAIGVSPDTALLRPVATTLAADQFTPTSARLNGQANPSGSPTTAWFEWGTSTNYGNVAAMQPVGSGLSISNVNGVISALSVGPDYHYRMVASNTFGVVKGNNQSFSLAAFLPSATTLPADEFTPSTARLNGQVNPNGFPATVWIEWGTSTNYGNATTPQNIVPGSSNVPISETISGLVTGPNYYYRLVATNAFGTSAGSNEVFNLSFLLTTVPGLVGVSVSSVAWGDYDNDGRLDFLLTGSSQTNIVSQLWRNMGNTFSNVTASVAPGLPGVYFGSAAWGDYDNDGWLDFLLTGNSGVTNVTQLWRNTGSGFSNVTASVASGLPRVSVSAVAWGDYDNDGRLDFLLTGTTNHPFLSGAISQLWRNTGSGFSNVTASVASNLPKVYAGSVAWADYDNDGWPDLLLTGTGSGNLLPLWRNTGSGFSNVTAAVAPGLTGATSSDVAWGDYDNDGRLDFLITGVSISSNEEFTQVWRNTGSGFSNMTATVAPGLPAVENGSLAWGDYDNDGRLDFLLTGTTNGGSSGAISLLWRNTGSGFSNVTASVAPGLPGVNESSVAWGDYDNDGRLDFLLTGVGNERVSQVWRNNLPVPSNAPPAAPTGLSAMFVGTNVTLSWNAPADDHTPADGLNYNVRIGTTPRGSDVVSAHALANGTRLLPQIGNAGPGLTAFYNLPPDRTYYWSVQAVDTSFAGSPFAVERQFTIAPRISNPVILPNGQFQFFFTNLGSAIYEVLGTTNVALPVTQWSVLGLPTSVGGGGYQFTNAVAPNEPRRFYLLRKQ